MMFINLVKYQIYLLQLENYNLARYFFASLGRFGRAGETRKQIVWTPKLQLLVTLAAVLAMTFDLLLVWSIGGPGIVMAILFVIAAAGLCYVFFFFLIAACVALLPVDRILKQRLISHARDKRAKFPNLKVIAIAGSYGKTTMKEMVASVLSQKYRVLKTSENINTPLGISQMILDRLNSEIDFMIIEVGEYVRGDVAEICELIKPSVGIITGINQAHLERMGSIQNTVASIFELADHVSGGLVLLNADDQLVKNNYLPHQGSSTIKFYGVGDSGEFTVQNVQSGPGGLVFEILQNGSSLGQFHTALLADYALGVTIAGAILGQQFDLTHEQIRAGVAALKPIPHRLEIIPNSNNVTVIDDSYNGNPNGVAEAIKVLSRFGDRRKLYITPGLVEMGADSPKIHYNIGKQLAPIANVVILIKNSVTGEIARGLTENGFSPDNIRYYDTAPQAHSDLRSVIQPGDVVMFQNDWPENYL